MGLGVIFIILATMWSGYAGGRFAFELTDQTGATGSAQIRPRSLRKGLVFGARSIWVLSGVVGLALVIADMNQWTLSGIFSWNSLTFYLMFCLSLGAFLGVIGAVSGGGLFVLIEMLSLVVQPAESDKISGKWKTCAAVTSNVGACVFSWCFMSHLWQEPNYYRIQLETIHRSSIAVAIGILAWWMFYHLFLKVRLVGVRVIIYGPVAGVTLTIFGCMAVNVVDRWFIHTTPLSGEGTQLAILFIRRCITGASIGTLYAIIAVAFGSLQSTHDPETEFA